MGKILLYMQVSADGVVSEPEKWMSLSDEIVADSGKNYDSAEAILFGSRTYQSLASYWQNAELSSENPIEREIAKKINKTPKIIISRSPVDSTIWSQTTHLHFFDEKDLCSKIQQRKSQIQKNILVESGLNTWRFFLRNRLFDELVMLVHPVVVGEGDKLFEDGVSMTLGLISSRTYLNGVVELRYKLQVP